MKKELGKIQNVKFGLGGYQDLMLGLHFTLENNDLCIEDSRCTLECAEIGLKTN